MWFHRSTRLLFITFALLSTACGSTTSSTLVTVKAPTGNGPVDFSVENQTDVPINTIYLAETSRVGDADHAASQPGSTAEVEVWGADRLEHALPVGERVRLSVPEPGLWDLRALDRDGRYQHIAALKLGPGGRYILRLGEGNWRVFR
jgi:hypothetical protein